MRPGLRRGVAVAASCTLLVLVVGYGAVTPDPTAGRFPSNGAVAAGAVDAGDRVVVAGTAGRDTPGGTVVTLDGGSRVVVSGIDADPGADVWLYGTYHGGTIRSERAVVRAGWEITYLYAVSLLGGALAFARIVRTWRIDTDRWLVVPREERDG
jgi:hypothetical protein